MGLLKPHGGHRGRARKGKINKKKTDKAKVARDPIEVAAQRRAVVVHALEHAEAALEAAEEFDLPVVLESAPGAARYLGAALFQAIVATAQHNHPDVTFLAVLDCADQPGLALAAIRHGVKAVRIDAPDDVRAKIADIAAQAGATVDTAERERLDLLNVDDPLAACRDWLSGETS